MSTLADTFSIERPRSNLGKRLVFWMIASSTLLAVLASAVQLYFVYERDFAETQDTFDAIERNFYPSLASALWEFNFKQVEVIVDSLAANKDVIGVDLETSTGHSFSRRKDYGQESRIVRVTSLGRTSLDGSSTHLGDLRIEITLDHIYQNLFAQVWTIMLTNMAKTILAAIVMLCLFHVLVSKHLSAISTFFQDLRSASERKVLRLARAPSAVLDDLDLMVEAINEAQERTAEAYAKVESLNEELDVANQSLKRSNTELEQFAHVAAHDLQEPVRKIMAFSDLLREECQSKLDDAEMEYIGFVFEAASQQRSRIRDLLAYAQVGGADGEGWGAVPLDRVLAASLDELSLALEDSGGTVETEPLPVVFGHEGQLNLILVNLIGNSIKYRSPKRGLRISIRAGQVDPGEAVSRSHRFCRLYFEDNGIGFPPEIAEEIFQPFYRHHSLVEHEGNGIGLAIVKKLVLQHGGAVTARGQLNRGASFVVDLPVSSEESPLK